MGRPGTRAGRCNGTEPKRRTSMKTKPDADNTELERNFEPLRVTLALGALLLGLLCGLH